MADVKWIKITTDIFDDEKILLIESLPSADSIITIWFKLLVLAGKQNNSGVFTMNDKIPYTDEMLATILRRDINTIRLALTTFEKFGMIEVIDGVITIPNWNKHQTLDAYERKKERDRLYQQERRNNQKNMILQKSSEKSSDVAVSDKEEDKDKENILCAPESHDDEKMDKEEELRKNFEIIYAVYPKKVGRTVAYANYKQWLSAKGKDVGGKRYRLTNRQIYLAVKKYVRQQEEAGKDDYQFWKNFDTLMGRQLLDYVEWEDKGT